MRLGFPGRVYGSANLPSHDARRWPDTPRLSVSLVHLRDLFGYFAANDIRMYRMHSHLIPVREDEGSVCCEIDACQPLLDLLGHETRRLGLRLSFHPLTSVVLNATNEEQVARSVRRLVAMAYLMDAMELGPEAVIVVHVGGVYDDLERARGRFVTRYEALPPFVRRRLALENDDRRFGYSDVHAIHAACGVPLVFDNLHHLNLNPSGITIREALVGALGTWTDQVTPKVHFCSASNTLRGPGAAAHARVPVWTEHGDFANPFEFSAFLRMARDLRPFDIMLEAKARDVALIKLRQDLARYAPDLLANAT